NRTVCYPCGNYILFLDIETKKTMVLQCQTGQVGAFAANGNRQVLAFSDRRLNPIIYIYTFPELSKLTELKGNVQLDYTLLAFSFRGPYLASYSSLPEFVLSVWNWQENILLCSESQPGVTATSLSFNPMNWRQLCFVTESSISIWHIERNNDEHHLKQNPVKLPDGQGTVSPHKDLFFPVSHSEDPYHGPDLPVSAIAGLVGDEAETFMPRDYLKPSVHPTAHCWTATSEIYMGCKEGYVLAIDAERCSASEGILFFYHIKGLQYEMKICADILQPISSLIFSPDYTVLLLVTDQATAMACCPSSNSVAVGTKRGQIYFLDVTKAEAPRVVHRIFLSKFPVLSLHNNLHWCSLPASVLADEVLDLSVVSDFRNDLVEVMVLLNVAEVQRARLEIFCLSSALTTDNDKYVDEQGMLNANAIKKEQYDLDYPLSSAVRLKDNIVYGYCACAPFICKYHLSEERIPSKQFGSGFLCLSPNSRWLASAAKDGVLFIYHTFTMHCHSYQGGGIRSMVFSLDGKFILINGKNDGALVCLKWKYSFVFCADNVPLDYFNLFFSSCLCLSFNNIFVVCQVIREETQRFSNQKEELQMGIKKLRKTIQKMMHENEQVPDIEKLEQHEFNLDIEELERAQAEAEQEVARVRKEIEMENLANRYLQDVIKRECWDAMCVKGRAVKCFHMACEVKNYPLKERSEEELETLEKVLQLKKIETADLKKAEEGMANGSASYCLTGSLSSQYGGDTSILYHQWDLHTREQRVNQIVLLKDIIYKVKTAFNKEFDIVARQKEQEIARVKERNVRIREILAQLDLQVDVWEPALTDDEIPERVLTVQDSEIKVEKYLTEQEIEKEEMLAKPEMERHLADNERLRALNDMMGGVLEVKKEDILKMVIPPPPFISKPEHVWNDEEKKIFREHEQKVKELNEEKEKYRRALENELKKLEASIQETTQNFDDTLCKLSEKKVKFEMVIYQEELKIVNLTYALMLDEELNTREAGLRNFLMKKEKEKNLECGFTKEFADVPANLLDELFQLYKHRPKAPVTEMLLDTANPYGDCPGSAEDYKDALTLLMKAMDELDSPEHRPNGLDLSIWERFCRARRNKMESEELVKWKALTLEDMQAFLQRRMDDNEKIKSEIENIFQELTWVQEEKMKLELNLTIQFLLKQGQVELESTEIPDYTDALLINKSIIEELNCSIMAQGEKKIASMVEYKDFSKGMFRLEWEHKKMRMQIEDLKQKARDIVTLPVTKDRQLFLTVPNHDSHIARHISAMEQTLGLMDKLHEKNVKNYQKRIKELEKCISLKEQANYKLSLELKEMLVSVSEKRHIFEAHISEKMAKQRYREILKQKHLRRRVKEQEEEFEVLQAEVERLRSRTFPAL
uniref:Cilia and flagella associated protein 43 n=1 Tax=Bubo bubo TaxID=30461 RepID=A0A8C0I9U0_BUBBB